MARKLDKEVIKKRIKDNKAVMRDSKKTVSANMTAATKGQEFNVGDIRQAFSNFIKSAVALKIDTQKLTSITE